MEPNFQLNWGQPESKVQKATCEIGKWKKSHFKNGRKSDFGRLYSKKLRKSWRKLRPSQHYNKKYKPLPEKQLLS